MANCIFCVDQESNNSLVSYHGTNASAAIAASRFTFSPTPSPDIMSSSSGGGGGPSYSMDILASVFFVVAAGWLLIALMYALLALTFLRIRARGDLDRIYEEDFGRVHICGNLYLPLGCLLRRYIAHLTRGDRPRTSSSRFMTRDERRAAMEVLLGIPKTTFAKTKGSEPDEVEKEVIDCEAPSSSPHELSSSLDEEPVCSICLGAYEDEDSVLQSVTCPHRFHSECILDWLQRQANLECPCCRFPMVSEEDVWKTVKLMRKERKKELRRGRRLKNEVILPETESQQETESTDSEEAAVASSSSQSSESSALRDVENLPVASASI